jgi:hypothetical protein
MDNCGFARLMAYNQVNARGICDVFSFLRNYSCTSSSLHHVAHGIKYKHFKKYIVFRI